MKIHMNVYMYRILHTFYMKVTITPVSRHAYMYMCTMRMDTYIYMCIYIYKYAYMYI